MPSPRLRGRGFLSSLLILCTLLTPLQRASAATDSSPILIGEVQWSGSSRSTADEWLELWNTGSESVDLRGWSLVGASDKPIYFTSSTSIAPQQAILVANYPASSDKTLLNGQIISLATTTLALSNDHLQIELHDQTGALRDSAGTGIKPPAGMSSPTNTSMIRTRLGTAWTWRSATSTFFGGAPDLGTPGICDECRLVPTDATPETAPTPPTEIAPTESLDLDQKTTTSTLPDPVISLLEPEEALLYGVTSTDLLEEQDLASTSTPTTPYESPSLGTSTTTLPTLPETTSASSTLFDATTTEIETPEDETLNDLPVPTSTLAVTITIAESTSTIANTPSTSSTSTETVVSAPVTPPTPAPAQVEQTLPDPLLTEIMSAPGTNEAEWIELKLPDGASPLRYIDWKLQVDGKTILVFTPTTLSTLEQQGSYLVANWKSARLKNAGATVSLVRADGTHAQEARYGTSPRGTSWVNDPATGWKLTKHPTRGEVNVLVDVPTPSTPPKTEKVPSQNGSPSSQKPTTAKSRSKKTAPTLNVPTSTEEIRTLELAAKIKPVETNATPMPVSTKKVKSKTIATKTTKTTKKSSSKKSLLIPSHVTHFETIPAEQLTPRVRVRLQGRVGSTVGVFGRQRFVLLAPDGRGLLVKATTNQPSPALGTTIEVTGLLFANDEGVQLQMQSGDLWKSVPSATTTTPRVVDWNAPGIEDQWSYTRLEGQVTDSRSSAIVLESQVGQVTVPIKAIIGYRAQRVKNGDTIEVSGIFDGRNGLWKVQPSQASDIVILKHPEAEAKTAATSPSNTQLPWNAIGIALGSVGAIEGIRRWLEKRRATPILPKQPLPSTP